MTRSVTAPKVAVVGSMMIDLITYTERVPDPGETLVGERFQMGFGGKGANQAVMARLLGAEVAMVGCLGDDPYGDMTIENFASFDIDTTHVHRVPGSSGVAPIWVEPDGSNRIIIVPGANRELTQEQAVRAVQEMPGVSVVVGQLEIPQEVTAAGFAAARDMGAVTILNPAPAALLDEDLLVLTNWLIPNEVEFEMLSGQPPTEDDTLVQFAADTGISLLVTLGEKGVALVSDSETVVRIPAMEADALDTTGAGDAFVGAFAYGLAQDMGALDAIRLATACAGDSVTRTGTQSSFPDAARSSELYARATRR